MLERNTLGVGENPQNDGNSWLKTVQKIQNMAKEKGPGNKTFELTGQYSSWFPDHFMFLEQDCGFCIPGDISSGHCFSCGIAAGGATRTLPNCLDKNTIHFKKKKGGDTFHDVWKKPFSVFKSRRERIKHCRADRLKPKRQ